MLLARTVVAFAFVLVVLLADESAIATQLLLGAATTAFLILLMRRSSAPPLAVLCAIAIASTGEVILSVAWGLYDYAHALIPLYVPPGHGVFFVLAHDAARSPLLQRFDRPVVRGVMGAGTIYALVSLVLAYDVWGAIWWVGAALLMLRSRSPLMLSICFVFTVALELLGTSLGNWVWMANVPQLGIPSANPPSGVGILYCVLDLLTVMLYGWLSRSDGRTEVVDDPLIAAAEAESA